MLFYLNLQEIEEGQEQKPQQHYPVIVAAKLLLFYSELWTTTIPLIERMLLQTSIDDHSTDHHH